MNQSIPDTVWLRIFIAIAKDEPCSILNIFLTCKKFKQISDNTRIYFTLYKSLYPNFNANLCFKVANWKQKFLKSKLLGYQWKTSEIIKLFDTRNVEELVSEYTDDFVITSICSDTNAEAFSRYKMIIVSCRFFSEVLGQMFAFITLNDFNHVSTFKCERDMQDMTVRYLNERENVLAVVAKNMNHQTRIIFKNLQFQELYNTTFDTGNLWHITHYNSSTLLIGLTESQNAFIRVVDKNGNISLERIFGMQVVCIAAGAPHLENSFITGHENKSVCLWNMDGQKLITLEGHSKVVWGFAFMDDSDDRDGKLNWQKPTDLILISLADYSSYRNILSHIELVVWNLNYSTKPLIRQYIPCSEVIVTFYAVFPFIYLLAESGNFLVYNLNLCSIAYSKKLETFQSHSIDSVYNISRPGDKLLVFLDTGIHILAPIKKH